MIDLASHWRALDAELVGRGWPACSPWWHDVITSWVSEPRRQLVLRVGRRGGKSSTLCRLAVLWALAIDHPIPPGDAGVIAFVSTSRDEASQRLRTIRALLDALGVAHRATADTIELAARPIVFRVFACSIAAVSGFTGVLVIADELAKWRDADSGANPASEVLAALRPTLATQPYGRIVLSSSPLATVDAHAEAFEAGNNEFQRVAHGATWQANPSITEAETRRLESDAKIWAREYAAIPQDAASSALDGEAIRAVCRRVDRADVAHVGRPTLVVDPSSGRGDSFTFAVATWVTPRIPEAAIARVPRADWPDWTYADRRRLRDMTGYWPDDPRDYAVSEWGEPVLDPTFDGDLVPFLMLSEMGGFDGAFGAQLPLDMLVTRMLRGLRADGWPIAHAVGDQRESYALEAEFRRHRVAYTSLPWTSTSKQDAIARLRRLLADRRLVIAGPKASVCEHQLARLSERILPSGTITYGARNGEHDDYAALAMTAAMADNEGLLPGSPLGTPRGGRNVANVDNRPR